MNQYTVICLCAGNWKTLVKDTSLSDALSCAAKANEDGYHVIKVLPSEDTTENCDWTNNEFIRDDEYDDDDNSSFDSWN